MGRGTRFDFSTRIEVFSRPKFLRSFREFLKKFLKLREEPCFDPIRQRGQIGIPCIVEEEGAVSFTWDKYL